MAVTEELKVAIESVFDDSGFDRFRASIAKANASIDTFSAKLAGAFDIGQQLRGARRQASQMSEVFEGVLENTDISLTPDSVNAPFFDSEGDLMGFEDPRLAEAIANQMERMDQASKNIPSNMFENVEGDQIPAVMGGGEDPSKPDGTPPLSRPTEDVEIPPNPFENVEGAQIPVDFGEGERDLSFLQRPVENITTPDEAFKNLEGANIPVNFESATRRAIPESEITQRRNKEIFQGLPNAAGGFSDLESSSSSLRNSLGVLQGPINRVESSINNLRGSASQTANRMRQYAMSNRFVTIASDKLHGRSVQLSRALGKVGLRARIASISIEGLAGSLASAAPAARNLQMKLLGLQFTLLTVAFVFGGLMAGALGAVGVFEVLGNTLRFFFLPSALNVLDGVLQLQSGLMNVDRSTRETIGNIFFAIAAFSAFGGIIAALLKPIVSLFGLVTTLTGGLGSLIGFFSKADTAGKGLINTLKAIGNSNTAIGGLKRIAREISTRFNTLKEGLITLKNGITSVIRGAFAKLVGILKIIGGSIANVIQSIFGFASSGVSALTAFASFFAGLIGGFLAVVAVAKRFGKKVALVFGVILAAAAGVVAFFASLPVIVIAAVGVLVGAVLGLLFTFRDTIISIFMGILKAIGNVITALIDGVIGGFMFIFNGVVGIFKKLAKILVGNSIIPDMVKSIVSFILSIPGKIAGIGQSIVSTIVNGLLSVGSSIFEAFKGILPDFVVDALIGAGSTVKDIGKGIADTAGSVAQGVSDVGKGVANGVNNFADGITNLGSDILGGNGSNNQGGKQNIQKNNINVNAQVNNSEETAGETGRQVGESIGNETNRRFRGKF